MAEKYEVERKGRGRRDEDQECADHDERLQAVERKLAWQKGAFYVAVGAIGLLLSVSSWIGQQVYEKVNTIEKMLVTEQVSKAELVGQIKALDYRLTIVESRHINEDQRRIK